MEGLAELGVAYVSHDVRWVVLLFAIATGAQGMQTSASYVNPVDLSPKFAGTISGMVSIACSALSVAVPIAIAFLTPNVSI